MRSGQSIRFVTKQGSEPIPTSGKASLTIHALNVRSSSLITDMRSCRGLGFISCPVDSRLICSQVYVPLEHGCHSNALRHL